MPVSATNFCLSVLLCPACSMNQPIRLSHLVIPGTKYAYINRKEKKRGLDSLVVSAHDLQVRYQRFESISCRDNFQTTSTPSSYSMCHGLSIKWTGRRLVTDIGIKCAWVIHESKAVQIHEHNNRRCLYVPQVPGSIKNLHNNKNKSILVWFSKSEGQETHPVR